MTGNDNDVVFEGVCFERAPLALDRDARAMLQEALFWGGDGVVIGEEEKPTVAELAAQGLVDLSREKEGGRYFWVARINETGVRVLMRPLLASLDGVTQALPAEITNYLRSDVKKHLTD